MKKISFMCGSAALIGVVGLSSPAMADGSGAQELRSGVTVKTLLAQDMQTVSKTAVSGFAWENHTASARLTVASTSRKASGFRWDADVVTTVVEPVLASTANARVQGFRWGIRSNSEQQGFRWGIRSNSEQQGFRWGIRSTSSQQGFRWGIRSTSSQQGFRWGIRSTADQQGFRWGIRNSASQQGFRWGIR